MMPIAQLRKRVLRLVVKSGEKVKRTSETQARDRERPNGVQYREWKNKAAFEFEVLGVPYRVSIRGKGRTVMGGSWRVLWFIRWPRTTFSEPATREQLQNLAHIMKRRLFNQRHAP